MCPHYIKTLGTLRRFRHVAWKADAWAVRPYSQDSIVKIFGFEHRKRFGLKDKKTRHCRLANAMCAAGGQAASGISPNRNAIWVVSQCDMGRFAMRYGLFCNAIWVVLQSSPAMLIDSSSLHADFQRIRPKWQTFCLPGLPRHRASMVLGDSSPKRNWRTYPPQSTTIFSKTMPGSFGFKVRVWTLPFPTGSDTTLSTTRRATVG